MSQKTKLPIYENAVYSREEAAQLLGVSLSTLKRLIESGQLVVSQPAGMRRVFIKGSSILRMLDATTVETGQHAR
ncbi:MAG: helix-turn-helix domain-containing protein [Caldilineales bacterium]|nr:helix-turn-helix domain-containing protein [Caldilineales bacterium]MDW8317229.1 helix-turn-helix domain-containing protein [Anaerolineae bacterium]